MLSTLRWIGPSLVPALLLLGVVSSSDRRRHPVWLIALTFALGAVAKAATAWAEGWAAAWTGLALEAPAAGVAGSLLFVFGFAGPVREASKVLAIWPAFRSRHFVEPLDGVIYAAAGALGFALVETALVLRAHPSGWIWVARTGLALPAHVFFACCAGYALGRARRARRPGVIFPAAWLAATVLHALYVHLVYGRGSAALVGALPLLLAILVASVLSARELRIRVDQPSRTSELLDRVSALSVVSSPPSLRTVREAMRREGQPIALGWIAFGALVTVGAMTAGLALSVAFGHWARVDFSIVDEHDLATTAPVALLGAGVLAAFPVSGYLVARASSLPTLLEPALASAMAIVLTLVLLGFAAPVVLVFALAFSPIAWALACAGAWVGRAGAAP